MEQKKPQDINNANSKRQKKKTSSTFKDSRKSGGETNDTQKKKSVNLGETKYRTNWVDDFACSESFEILLDVVLNRKQGFLWRYSNQVVLELLTQDDSKVHYHRMIGTFLKALLVICICNIFAIFVLPSMLSSSILLLSAYTLRQPCLSVYTILRFKTSLRDSIIQFNFHRMAFDKALSQI